MQEQSQQRSASLLFRKHFLDFNVRAWRECDPSGSRPCVTASQTLFCSLNCSQSQSQKRCGQKGGKWDVLRGAPFPVWKVASGKNKDELLGNVLCSSDKCNHLNNTNLRHHKLKTRLFFQGERKLSVLLSQPLGPDDSHDLARVLTLCDTLLLPKELIDWGTTTWVAVASSSSSGFYC